MSGLFSPVNPTNTRTHTSISHCFETEVEKE